MVLPAVQQQSLMWRRFLLQNFLRLKTWSSSLSQPEKSLWFPAISFGRFLNINLLSDGNMKKTLLFIEERMCTVMSPVIEKVFLDTMDQSNIPRPIESVTCNHITYYIFWARRVFCFPTLVYDQRKTASWLLWNNIINIRHFSPIC